MRPTENSVRLCNTIECAKRLGLCRMTVDKICSLYLDNKPIDLTREMKRLFLNPNKSGTMFLENPRLFNGEVVLGYKPNTGISQSLNNLRISKERMKKIKRRQIGQSGF